MTELRFEVLSDIKEIVAREKQFGLKEQFDEKFLADVFPGTTVYYFYEGNTFIGRFAMQRTEEIHPALGDYTRGSIYLYAVEIDRAHRAQGYGKRMLSFPGVLDRGREKYFLTVLPDNVAAVRIYQSLGFTRRGQVLAQDDDEQAFDLYILE